MPSRKPRWLERSRPTRPEPAKPERPEPKPVRIDFTPIERAWLIADGNGRQARAHAAGGVHKWNDRATPEQARLRHIDAASAEAAVAKLLNLWWHPTPYEPGVADVAGFIEVRWTDHHVNAKLHVHDADDESRIFVLVSGNAEAGGIFVRGWLYGFEAKRDEWHYVRTPGRPAAWWVPWEFLRDLDTLPDVHRYRLTGEPEPAA
jgi:hypothetical protein